MTPLFRFPSAVTRDPAVEAWLWEPDDALRRIARTWFERMRGCGSDVRELMHDGCPTVCVEDAAFGYVNVFRGHASVGFFMGAALEDPRNLLEGTGKRMRHVKLRPDQTIRSEALEALITSAYDGMRLRLRSV